MNKPTYNIAQPTFLGNEKKYLMDAIDTGWVSSIGKYIEQFEKEFAAYHGLKHGIATHNGTIALHLALAALGVGPGDEVIVPDLTFIATANAVRYCGAKPVLADVNDNDWNIDPSAIRSKISPATRAVIPVHLYGNPARMDEIQQIGSESGITIIEDCAEAPGAHYQGQLTGTFGKVSCFSFFGNKIMTTGEGGMCLTNDDELAERMRILRDHGMNRQKKYWYDFPGFNYRMTNMQAAVGLAQLEQLRTLLQERDQIFHLYNDRLSSHQAILLQDFRNSRHVNWIFTLRIRNFTEEQRDRVMVLLKEAGVDSRPVFYPIHQMPFYQGPEHQDTFFPNTCRISREGISLPTYIGLKKNDIQYITDQLFKAIDIVWG